MTNYYALVPAAGSGSRMGGALPKQYLPLAGRPLIWHALFALCATPVIGAVFVVLAADDTAWPGEAMQTLGPKLHVLRRGGPTRAQSVLGGLQGMAEVLGRTVGGTAGGIADDWVLVHDAARPCLSMALVEKLIAEAGEDAVGGLLASPVVDTLKRADDDGRVAATVPRTGLWQAQTPQMFRYGRLREALLRHPEVTDEAGAIEAMGFRPRLVASPATNFKVTHSADLHLAEWILQNRETP
ncbi:MAG: 2-C-methyl-D-erythritol 4-phosphate cytidylyltransferase [Betaproteobacteria bacterium HGW-Betaproteobacteria-11]|nr:MAG: 2-C-methyl-D-erythritol 4-phosphate cytidylyltransferase [Betaproteobacteria bacterium HGW-Betaproteobacteria-11]